MNKASGGDGIPVELFQILKDDTVKVLHSICQHIWKTQQWPQDWKRSVVIPIPKKGNAKEFSKKTSVQFSSVHFSHSVVSDSLRQHESQHARPPCPSPTPGVHSNSCHRVGVALQPSHPLSTPSPPAPKPSQHHSLFQ